MLSLSAFSHVKEKLCGGSHIQSGEPEKSESETRSKYALLFHKIVVAFLDLLIMGEKRNIVDVVLFHSFSPLLVVV